MANITFKNAELAKKAVTKFNGAPIDNGRSRLRLNLIVSAVQSNQDLSQRIKPLPGSRIPARNQNDTRGPARATRGNQNQRQPPQKNNRAPNKKAAVAKKQRRERPAKKSLEELDKEMADYFEEKK